MPETPQYELETVYEIWDNKHGDHLEIGPDRDGLGLFEIRSFHKNSSTSDPGARLVLNSAQIPLLIQALVKLLPAEHNLTF